MVGALLRIVVDIDCGCGGQFKWKQYINEKRGNNITKNNKLDIGDRDPIKDEEWYADFKVQPVSVVCAYTFEDSPTQMSDVLLMLAEGSPNKIDRVDVNIKLHLVRKKNLIQNPDGMLFWKLIGVFGTHLMQSV